MKKFIPVILGLILMANLHGQMFSVSVAPTYVHIFPKTYYGFPEVEPHFGIGISADYQKYIGNRFSMGLGIDYQQSSVEVGSGMPLPGEPPKPAHEETVKLLSTSIKVVYNFNYGLFITANPFVEFQLDQFEELLIENHNGIGISFSCGKRFQVSQRVGLFLEPVIWIKNIIELEDNTYPVRLNTIGLKAGVSIQ
ncbi:MAG: hypothetical protein ABFS38_08325 [Bacteroidota bacterium]